MVRKQILIAAEITIVIFVALWFTGTAMQRLALPLPTGDDIAARLAFAVQWLVIPGLTLLAGIALVSVRRFFSADAIDGTRTPASRSLEINLRYNQNTVEQIVLAAIARAGLALALPHERLSLIPAMAVLFGVGRVLFWLGYLAAPWARAIGYGFSFYPSVVALLWLGWRALG